MQGHITVLLFSQDTFVCVLLLTACCYIICQENVADKFVV